MSGVPGPPERRERESNRAPHSGVTNRIGGNLYVQHHFYIGVARPILPATDLYVGQDNGLAGVQGLSNALLVSPTRPVITLLGCEGHTWIEILISMEVLNMHQGG